jgi:hypothetical protein
MMAKRHGGMACMAQEYHGDVDGLFHKINNVGIIDVNEQKVCYARKETKYLAITKARGRMMSW